MNELERIVATFDREGRTCVLATVVQTTGSTYRRPGAHMLIGEDGWLAGGVSGGCLERDVLQKSWWRTSSAEPALIVYDARTEDDEVRWRFGLGCEGSTTVLLERVEPGAAIGPLGFVRQCLEARRPGVMATVIASAADGSLRLGQRLFIAPDGQVTRTFDDAARAADLERDAREALTLAGPTHKSYPGGAVVFFEIVQPPRPLVVFGSGFDVLPLVELAKLVGWHVTVVETRPSLASDRRFAAANRRISCAPDDLAAQLTLAPDDAVIIMNHDYERDRAALELALASPAGYIGVLGPRRRTDRMLGELARPLSPSDLERLHAPVGFEIGAEGPQEIALSVVAEVQAHFKRPYAEMRRGRNPDAKSHLRDDRPVHLRLVAAD
jgi:xanthine dehydrogenase accessory factor